MGLRNNIHRERSALVATLRSLTPEQWAVESLCAGWSIKDVAAHLAIDSVPLRSYLSAMPTHPSADKLNNHFVNQLKLLSTDELIEKIYQSTNTGWLSRFLPQIALPDNVIHHQDILRPLEKHRIIAPEILIYTLNHPDPFAKPRQYTRKLHWAATDLDWSQGKGPLISGPAEALALAMVGRSIVLDELSGEGVPILRRRMG